MPSAITTPQAPELDRSLILRYDRPGPRYTSYPTAPHFSDDFGPEDYREMLARSAATREPLSVYVHIPFCKSRCFFCGCNVKIARDRQRGLDYLDLLDREMAHAAALSGAKRRPVVQIHWGGGTPTFLPPAGLERLAGIIRHHFRVVPECEVGVEVDPRECTEDHLGALAEAGFNRISLGVQDLDPKVQQAVNRLQPLEQTRSVVEGARKRGMGSLNIDLIYGLPHQTPESFEATLREVVALEPDRLAIFNFAYLPATIPHQRAIDEEAMPKGERKLDLLERALEVAAAAGYVFIGMDHFARPDDPLARALEDGTLGRNFQGYTTHGDVELAAFGVSAIGALGGGYAQNVKDVPSYSAALDDEGLATCRGLVLTAEDRLRRDVIMDVMSHFRLDKAEIEGRHEIDFDRHFSHELEDLRPLEADGLVELAPKEIRVTSRGRLLVRNVAMVFDAYLREGRHATYSRTV